jgi:hypothetical protein
LVFAELGWERGEVNSSGKFCSNHLTSSRQEPLLLERFGGPRISAPVARAFLAGSSILFGCSVPFSPFSDWLTDSGDLAGFPPAFIRSRKSFSKTDISYSPFPSS